MKKTFDVLSGVLLGALVGATAVFLAEEKNRKKILTTVNDWKEKGTDELGDLKEKAEKFREKGLEAVSHELSKVQEKVEKSKK